ncbi:MAG TPA: hypothetical protein VG097_03780 [Gemmata sp.]|jgi:hypothetical protein|nr:hypothetical protein [Gemmata sp.]
MAAFIFVGENWESDSANPKDRSILLEDDGYYWFLYRYFEGAKLYHQHQSELVDLYGGGEIDGYQLHRLETELKSALEAVGHKPEQWRMLTGWNGEVAIENEIWKDVEKDKMILLIQRLLWLIEFAKERSLKLIVSGD